MDADNGSHTESGHSSLSIDSTTCLQAQGQSEASHDQVPLPNLHEKLIRLCSLKV